MTIEIALTQGLVALVDDEDAPLVVLHGGWEAKLCPSGNYYAVRVRHGAPHLSMHRLVLGAAANELVDHRNGLGFDNQKRNLRRCTSLENARHREHYVRRKREQGGYLGVSYNKRAKLWAAGIHAGEPDAHGEARRISLRYYATAEEAARVYDSAALYYFGDFAALNFPQDEPAAFDLLSLRGTSLLTAEQKGGMRSQQLRDWCTRNGKPSPRAKLSQEDVDRIRSGALPVSQESADRLGVSLDRLRHVRGGRGWRGQKQPS